MDNQTTLGISIGLVLKGLSSVKSADNAIKGLARSAKNTGVSVKSISENLRGLKGVSKDIARYKQTISDEIGKSCRHSCKNCKPCRADKICH